MDLKLTGKTAWITGASKGIGFATARTLAHEGCEVVMVARTASDLETAAESLRGDTNASIEIFSADLSESAEIQRLWATHAAPDILVNNAGAIPSGSILDVDEQTWRQSWELKVFGYINMCREALARMSTRGSGVIINVIGGGGEKPRPSYAAGAGGNGALIALTRALGSNSTLKGVRVVGINPGLIHTERLETLMRSNAERRWGNADRWKELLDPKFPPGNPEHIADAVAFLASDLSGNTTGTILTIDGGACSR